MFYLFLKNLSINLIKRFCSANKNSIYLTNIENNKILEYLICEIKNIDIIKR